MQRFETLMQYFINHEEFHIDFMVLAVTFLLLRQVFELLGVELILVAFTAWALYLNSIGKCVLQNKPAWVFFNGFLLWGILGTVANHDEHRTRLLESLSFFLSGVPRDTVLPCR